MEFKYIQCHLFNKYNPCFKHIYRTLYKIESDVNYFDFKQSDPRAQRLYVWGCADHGALGELKVRSRKNRLSFIHRPVRKQFAYTQQIADIASGFGFSLFAVKNKHKNKLFGCGINSDSQIGYHDSRRNHPVSLILSMVPVQLPIKSVDTNIIKVAAGRAHSVALTDKEGMFLFGNNAYGQCARPINSDEDYTKMGDKNQILNLDGSEITNVTCGQDHSLFLTKDGEVYSCGLGADGQTGLGHYRTEWKPTKVEGAIKGEVIVKVVSTCDSVLAINDKGEIFGWGNSEYSQLPKSGVVQVCSPIRLGCFDHVGKIKDIAAGGTTCLALNVDGEVFVWGYGILGKGPQVMESDVPIQIPSTLFGRNQFQPDNIVTAITCGVRSMMAVTNLGELYAWGKNDVGQLGLGHTDDQMFPLQVSLGGRITKVCCGVDHTIALCKPFI